MSGLLLLIGVLAGCSSVVTGTASPGAPPAPASPDSTALEAAMLQAGDLPAGWTAVGPPARDTGMMVTFRTCLGARVDPAERLAVAASPTYIDATGDWAASVVSSFRSRQRIADDTALFRDPRAYECFTKALVGGLDRTSHPGVEWGNPTIALRPGSGGGPATVVASITARVPMRASTGERRIGVLQYYFLAGTSTEAVVTFGSVGAPLDQVLRSRIVAAVAERVAPL
jgi:hypothetical protein